VSEEKKFKLDELPDEGSNSEPQVVAPKKKSQPVKDPRITKLKDLDDASRIDVMEQSWHFDVPEWSFNWVPVLVALIGTQWSGYFSTVRDDIIRARESTMTIGADVFIAPLEFGAFIFKHPIILAVLLPLFFRLKRASDYLFKVKFEGIETVKRFLPFGSKEQVQRTLVKWQVITEVKKIEINGKEILSLSSLDGHIADIIWYIDIDKKRALKVLLNGMITSKHPMRVFLENEKELK
jgi:hypothetical protein